jgi:hypothetical protein
VKEVSEKLRQGDFADEDGMQFVVILLCFVGSSDFDPW